MKQTDERDPSMLPYLAIAAVLVGALLTGLTAVVERAAAPLEAHVARSMGMQPAGETALAGNQPAGRPTGEPFRPRS
ncbi:MAG: hypothetical protein ACREBN_07730 [Burkholderiaceae bacterium]